MTPIFRKRYAPGALIGVAGVVVSGLFTPGHSVDAAPPSGPRALSLYARSQIDGPPIGHTGGFGEPTCAECHIGSPSNEPGSTLEVVGLGSSYQPGTQYLLTIRLRSFDMLAAGFQAALRWDEGPRRGTSAGDLRAVTERAAIVANESGDVQYAQHTRYGTRTSEGAAEWVFEWSAPNEAGSVALHVAANSGNGDNSPLDDLIYTHEVSLKPATTTPTPDFARR